MVVGQVQIVAFASVEHGADVDAVASIDIFALAVSTLFVAVDSNCLYFSVDIATFVIVVCLNKMVAVELEPELDDLANFHRLCIVCSESLHLWLAVDSDRVVVEEPN